MQGRIRKLEPLNQRATGIILHEAKRRKITIPEVFELAFQKYGGNDSEAKNKMENALHAYYAAVRSGLPDFIVPSCITRLLREEVE